MFSFYGRRSRLNYFGIAMLATVLSLPLFVASEMYRAGNDPPSALWIVSAVLAVPAIWINLANGVQRCHDLGWSGWRVLIGAIPLVGIFFGLWLLFAPGERSENKYGPSPLGIDPLAAKLTTAPAEGAAPLGAVVALNVTNRSDIGSFLWIGFYSTILTFFTLTLFRFWGRTIVRRRLWAETAIGGEPLEYTGKGMELFVGFLIAIVTVMVPLVGTIVAAQLFLPPVAFVIVVLLVYIVMFILAGVAIFLARRYQLSRTLWRGVRFEQRGSALGFGLAAFGYGLLSIITFGWFAPAMRLRLEKMFWNNAYFGDEPFSYDNSAAARTEPVYLSYVLAVVGFIIYYALIIGGMASLGLMESLASGGPPSVGTIAALYGLILGGVLVLVFFVAWHEAVMLRQITKSIRFQGVSLRSRFNSWDLIGLIITNVLLIIFTLGFGAVAAQMRVWKKICQRLEVSGEIDFAKVGQAASRGPKSGEGMLDAFDMSGGV